MKIAVIGTGYVGLVTGTCFAEMGNEVFCVDIDEDKVNRMKAGEVPIFEPGLELFFERNLKAGRLTFTTEMAPAVLEAEVVFLALPTPPGEDGSADLSYVLGVAGDIAALLASHDDAGYKVLVDKSTVPVGTADRVRGVLEAKGLAAGEHFDVVSNPEFLREGAAVDDFMKPDRVVIGSSSERAIELMEQLYEPFVRQGNPILVMDERSAEMTKYAANAFLATKITFMNEVAQLCERSGANVDMIRRGIGTDPRIGKHFLYAGIGYGGSCFPKDVKALRHTAGEHGYDFQILNAVVDVNERQRAMLVERLKAYYGESLATKHFAVWGLAFKPNTDDVREAPSHVIMQQLAELGATCSAYDPEAMETTQRALGDLGGKLSYSEGMYDALRGADALIICTEWHAFRRPDFNRIKEALSEPVLFDGRNLYDTQRMEELGFGYYSVGRPTSTTPHQLRFDQQEALSSEAA